MSQLNIDIKNLNEKMQHEYCNFIALCYSKFLNKLESFKWVNVHLYMHASNFMQIKLYFKKLEKHDKPRHKMK